MKKYTFNKETLTFEEYHGRRGIGFAAVIMVALFTITSFRAGNPIKLKEKVYLASYENYEDHLLYDEIKSTNKDAFILMVKSVAKRTDIPYQDLMVWMYCESGLDYKNQNKSEPFNDGTYATGLIQWTPVSREELGITYADLLHTNEFEQLELIYRYITTNKKKIKCFSDLYLMGYLPAYVGKPDDTIIPDEYYNKNKALGRTLGEFRRIVNKKYYKILRNK